MQLDYCNLTSEAFDFLYEIVTSMGITLNECRPDDVDTNKKSVDQLPLELSQTNY